MVLKIGQAEAASTFETDVQAVDVAGRFYRFTDRTGFIRTDTVVSGAIIGRMAAPGSELATHYWLDQRSGLGELPLHHNTSLFIKNTSLHVSHMPR